jgi:hypothetical protein
MARVRRPTIAVRFELGSRPQNGLADWKSESGVMPYAPKSLACFWFVTLGLFALAGAGVVSGPWLILLLAVGLSAPALILKDPVGATHTSDERAWVVKDGPSRPPVDRSRIDVIRWENEGGALRRGEPLARPVF